MLSKRPAMNACPSLPISHNPVCARTRPATTRGPGLAGRYSVVKEPAGTDHVTPKVSRASASEALMALQRVEFTMPGPKVVRFLSSVTQGGES